MINCNEFRNFAEGLLEGETRPEVSAHLSVCTSCQTLLEDLKAISSAAASLPANEPRPELWQSIEARAQELNLLPQVAAISCEEFSANANGLLDGENLPVASAHLFACSQCQALMEDLKAISSAAASLPAFEPRPELWQSIEARAQELNLLPQEAAMSCEEFYPHAGSVLEGERDPKAFEHIYGCASCRNLLHDLDAVAREAHHLPTHEPRAALWYKIRTQARAEALWQEESWLERWLMLPQPVLASGFAGLLLVLGLGLVGPQPSSSLTDFPLVTPMEIARSEMVSDADYSTRYQIHLTQVQRAVLDEGTHITDEMIDMVERPLNTVDRAIENTRLALAENPGDMLVQDELNRLYRQKASVLQTMTELTWQEYGE